MKRCIMLLSACLVWGASSGRAQQRLEHPEQFYTNGDKVGGWTRNEAAQLRSTFWFAKNPADSLSYRQQVVIVFDDQPSLAYYYDAATKKFVGRADLDSMRYSLLPEEARRERLEEIPESAFPPAGEMPTVGEMFERLPPGMRPNSNMMMMPPPTMSFPRLEMSLWDSNYTTADGRRVRAHVELNGDHGTYRLVQSNQVGRLSDVRYRRGNDEFVISGRWTLGTANGSFSFTVPMDNIDVFWGTWSLRPGRVDGTWDGVRRPR